MREQPRPRIFKSYLSIGREGAWMAPYLVCSPLVDSAKSLITKSLCGILGQWASNPSALRFPRPWRHGFRHAFHPECTAKPCSSGTSPNTSLKICFSSRSRNTTPSSRHFLRWRIPNPSPSAPLDAEASPCREGFAAHHS